MLPNGPLTVKQVNPARASGRGERALARGLNPGSRRTGAVRPPALVARMLPLLLLAPALAGCSLVEEPKPRQLEGPTDGYLATSPYLKVYVRSNSSGDIVLVDFDRRDWYVWKIAERLDGHDVGYLTVEAKPRDIIREYLVERVTDPADLEQYRYANMEATPQEQARMDAQYTDLLDRLAQAGQEITDDATGKTPALPTVPALGD